LTRNLPPAMVGNAVLIEVKSQCMINCMFNRMHFEHVKDQLPSVSM
jgi:hypothetical protein